MREREKSAPVVSVLVGVTSISTLEDVLVLESRASGMVDGSGSNPDRVRGSVRVGAERDSLREVPSTESSGGSSEVDVLTVSGLLGYLEVDGDGTGSSSSGAGGIGEDGGTGRSSSGSLLSTVVSGGQESDVGPMTMIV
jgi:hypothetical protein